MTDHHVPAERETHQPSGVDTTRPTPARMYDYYLGGKDNFAVDREAAERVLAASAGVREAAWGNRRFLQRAVRCLADEGIEQFIDLGAGLPTVGNVHEIAQAVNPDARVVYVDNDPVVLAHGRALLAGGANTTVITGDMRRPHDILGHPDTMRLIDFRRRVAVLFVATLHFVPDEDEPYDLVRAYRETMAAGSHLVISHATTQGPSADQVAAVEDAYENATARVTMRSETEISAFFDGFDLLPPGLTRPDLWRPDPAQPTHTHRPRGRGQPAGTDWLFAGVGRRTTT
ncbi:SAM-dependent methyltransferase [Embleya sp. NPDC008237]|uniref:SAM-dependent methyltransferase n=1 Tax=Embleya sp. NPDC008237 TaxID=3363978 RepID=UPI0036EDCD83